MSRSGHEPDVIPLFPLANVVLFPSVSVPLYIFEPRYRQMTRDAAAGDRCIGMIAVDPRHADGMAGDPPLFRVGCEGRIEQLRERPDGTFDMLLVATRRFRIVQELPRPEGQLYRSARVEGLTERLGAPLARLEETREEIFELLGALLRRTSPASAERLSPALFQGVEHERLVSSFAQGLDLDVVEKQRILEADGVCERYEVLADLLRFRLAALGSTPESGPLTVH